MSFNPVTIDQQSTDFIKRVCENASKRLEIENGVECADWKGIHTIAIRYLEEVARELGVEARKNGGEAKINLHQVMTIGVDMRTEDDAEKEGNLTVSMQAGPLMKQLIKNDALTEADE